MKIKFAAKQKENKKEEETTANKFQTTKKSN